MFLPPPQCAEALHVLGELRAAGYEAYLAGGCVRDLLLGLEPHDYDVATSATPDVVLAMFPRTFAVGAHFGVVLVSLDAKDIASEGDIGPASNPCTFFLGAGEPKAPASPQVTAPPQVVAPPQVIAPPQVVEVATFRSDGVYSDGRHPDGVRYTQSAKEDVLRRDFTINGMLLDPISFFLQGVDDTQVGRKSNDAARLGQLAISNLGRFEAPSALREGVIDYVGGLADLDAGVIRAIGSAEHRFEEDHLRMLRAVRFAARLGFELEAQTRAAIAALAAKTAYVSRERVRDELTKMLIEGHARRAFELLDETGLLIHVLPEVARMKGVEQPPQFHPEGDVWTHTLLLLDQLKAGCPLTLAWGALLHDVGKPPTFRREDRIRFNGHVEVGVAMGAEICRRFRFSNEETRQILALIENHMRFGDAPRMKSSTLKRFFRLENFEQHLALHRMDCLAGSGNLDYWNFVRERYETMPAETVRPQPLLTGRELIAAGYRPGAQFKQMLHTVEDAQLEGMISTSQEALHLVQERFGLPGFNAKS